MDDQLVVYGADRTVCPVQELPTGLLISMVCHGHRSGKFVSITIWENHPDIYVVLVRELRRSGQSGAVQIGPRLRAIMNNLDPPPCHCGRKGLYIVGSTTFCSRHRHEATRQRQQYTTTVLEPRANACEQQRRENERRLTTQDRLRRWKRWGAAHVGHQ